MKNLMLAALVLFTGCATSSHRVTGTLRPKVAPEEVKIYKLMPAHAQVIGVVTADSFAGWDLSQATANAVIDLQTQAGKLGANGLFVSTNLDQPLNGAKISGQAIYIAP